MSFFSFSSNNSSNKPQILKKSLANPSKEPKVLSKDYVPKRFGLKYDPPMIILEYMLQEAGKLYHHKMKLLNLKENSNTFEFLDYLKKKHTQYLANERITDDQLISLIDKLKSKPKAQPPNNNALFSKVDTTSNQTTTKLSKLEPLSSNFQTNKVIKNTPNLIKKPDNNKNSSDFWTSNKPMGSDDMYADDFETEDLNKLDTETLKQKKAKMDVLFNKNQKKPGDEDFEYDIQEDFEPKMDNEWDMDEDENEDIV